MMNFMNALLPSTLSREQLLSLLKTPELTENEVLAAHVALKCHELGIPHKKTAFPQLASGAIALFQKSYFPWGALPYPKELEELRKYLAQIPTMKEVVEALSTWQQRTLDHRGLPLRALFTQEGISYEGTEPKGEKEKGVFYDDALAMCGLSDADATILSLATGCKSGMGMFLYQDAGIVNFGPQALPLGDSSGFGLAGKGRSVHFEQTIKGYTFSYTTALAAPSKRVSQGLQDSAFSGLWVHATHEVSAREMVVKTSFEGVRPLTSTVLSFFGKGQKCVVTGSHGVRRLSLDRYVGPPSSVELRGQQGSVKVEATQGVSKMEVIPLSGKESFWGADFLVAFTLEPGTQIFNLVSLDP